MTPAARAKRTPPSVAEVIGTICLFTGLGCWCVGIMALLDSQQILAAAQAAQATLAVAP